MAPRNGKIRIAVLGTLVDHKGGRTVAAVAELADPNTTEIHLIGHTDGPFSESALARMQVTGRYDEADLPALITTIAPHVIWFPAVWPETFSFTVSAAIDAGAAIAATRIGAHTERLDGRPFTWLADITTSPEAWIRLFDEIRSAVNGAINNAGVEKTAVALPMRIAVADFYATNYLRPAVTQRPARRSPRRLAAPRVAIIPERFDVGFPTPCAYIRLLQPLTHPAVARDFDVRVTTPETIFDHLADVIVTQRFAIPDLPSANRLAAHARRIGATLVFDLDDDLLTIPRSHPDAQWLRPRSKVARRMLDVADVVRISSPGLAARLSSIRPDALVTENGLDERIWTGLSAPSHDQPVRILCMGTTTHDNDFALIEPALSRLKAEYDDRVVIDIVGMTSRSQLPPGLNRIGPPANAVRSYPGFVHWLGSAQPGWHIGLAPLLDTPFNLCKSPIKAMDYAALGMAVLASDTPVYRGSIADGPAGRLVANTQAAWYAALNWLVRNRDARHDIAARSRGAFLARASLASQGAMLHRSWSGLFARKSDAAA